MINKNLYDSLLRLRKSQKKYYKLVYLMRKHANENLSKEMQNKQFNRWHERQIL